jgi:hypothetical protein
MTSGLRPVSNMAAQIPQKFCDEVLKPGLHFVKRVELRLLDQPGVESHGEFGPNFSQQTLQRRKEIV